MTSEYVSVDDSAFEECTLTREQVMRLRGYGDESTGTGGAAAPPIKPKRVVRKYDKEKLGLRKKGTMTVVNGSASATPSVGENHPAKRSSPASLAPSVSDTHSPARVVSIVSALTAAGLHVGMTVDAVQLEVWR